jgi:hypothetical protein
MTDDTQFRQADTRFGEVGAGFRQVQYVGCRWDRSIAGSHTECQRLTLQDAREYRGRCRVNADGPHLDTIGAIDLERAVSMNDRRRKLAATDDQIAAVP